MERQSEPDKTVHPGTTEAAAQADRLNPASAHSKRLKELQNAALQTTLMAARMEAANLSDAADTTTTTGGEEEEAGSLSERHAGEGEQSNGLPFRSQSAPRGDDPPLPPPPNNQNLNQRDPADGEEDEEKTDSNVQKEASEQERTLTDHLNKRLLSSFLEKLNERDLQALPGVQRLDCAVAAGEEDSNRAAADDW